MITVGVNPPKTPVTEKSMDTAPCTLPNVCKMPGPPAPFVPTPLPNIGQSRDNLSKCTTTVKIQGAKVAIKGSYYKSMPSPDVASQGTGGGILSSCTQGKTEFVAPGSMNVKFQGKNVQLLGDAMTNNGSSKNTGATLPGNLQAAASIGQIEQWLGEVAKYCHESIEKNKKTKGKSCKEKGTAKHKCCENYINKNKGSNPIATEVGFRKNGQMVSSRVIGAARRKAKKAYEAAKAKAKAQKKNWRTATEGLYMREFRKAANVSVIADAVVGPPPSPPKPYDFKFNCTSDAKMDKDQKRRYDEVTSTGALDEVQVIGTPNFTAFVPV